MEFKRTGPNSAEVTTADSVRILFSYGEPVALLYQGIGRAQRTDRYVSRTTEQHIKEFLREVLSEHVERISHDEILRATKAAR